MRIPFFLRIMMSVISTAIVGIATYLIREYWFDSPNRSRANIVEFRDVMIPSDFDEMLGDDPDSYLEEEEYIGEDEEEEMEAEFEEDE